MALVARPISAPDLEVAPPAGQHQTRLKPEQADEIVRRYEGGATTYDLAKEFNCRRSTISGHRRRADAMLRRSGLLPVKVTEAIRLYNSGLSLAAVGGHFEASGDTVATRLKERGVAIRNAGRGHVL